MMGPRQVLRRVSRMHRREIACLLLSLVSVLCLLFITQSIPRQIQPQVFSVLMVAKNVGLDVPNKITGDFTLDGAIYSVDGKEIELESKIKVSLIHSYSPYTENHFREMMVDPVRNEHRIYANSPAILQTDSGEIITVMRIWLEKEIWDLTKRHPHNSFQDNYFYIQKFNQGMKPLSRGSILGIPTPTQWSIGDGPIEPRIFSVNSTMYLTFNTGVKTQSEKSIDSTFFWDLKYSRALLPNLTNGQPMLDHTKDNMPRDKHWSALVNDTRLYFTYNLDPLRVIECRLNSTAECSFVHKEGDENYIFKDARDSLRGGTPFVLYKYPYYISVAHGTFFRDCKGSNTRCHGKRYYTTHLVFMTIEPVFKIIYISGNIPFPEASFRVPIVRYRFIYSSFFFPVGLILENSDSLVLGGHVNDHSSVLYRISNISAIADKAIGFNQKDPHKLGPKPQMLQQYVNSMARKFSGFDFQSG